MSNGENSTPSGPPFGPSPFPAPPDSSAPTIRAALDGPLDGPLDTKVDDHEIVVPQIVEARQVAAAQAPQAHLSVTDVIERIPGRMRAVRAELKKAIVGQEDNVQALLYALLARGHCLLVGVPGLAKTMLVQALARVLNLSFKRIQFTPDLMPADITGTTILQRDGGGEREFQFVRGPIFTQLLLADEINRTPPKTQAALLEAMQEKTVTVAGQTLPLEEPFFVLATQNPIEQEGTYPLPEAQLDRFLFELHVGYPTLEEERLIVAQHSFTPLQQLTTILERHEILLFRDAVSHIPAPPNVIDYAVRLTRATRPADPASIPELRKLIRWGASPRASQNMLLAARARAACEGRFNVACEDIVAVAPLILRHRVLRSFHAEAEGRSIDDIVATIVRTIPRN